VFQNLRSPALYINRSLNLTNAQAPPKSADPKAPPEWQKIGDGNRVTWHDHSAHYMGTQDPPIVQRDPSQRHLVDRYTVKLRWNGEDVVARGRIIWVPPPTPWPYVAVAVLLAAAVVWASRTRRWVGVFAGALGVLIVTETLHVIGLYTATTDTFGTKAYASLYSVAGIVLAMFALGWMRRKGGESAVPLVLLASIFLFVAGGLADITALARSQLPTTFSPTFARLLITLTLGLGLGTAIGAAWRLRPTRLVAPTPRPRQTTS